jgi:hypothetical protein
MNETDLLHAFIEAAPFALPNVRIFRRNVINVQAVQGFRARNGIPGQADAYAIVKGGLHIEIETKAARGKLAAAQLRWRDFCHTWRVPHLVLRAGNGEAPDATIERWLSELLAAIP